MDKGGHKVASFFTMTRGMNQGVEAFAVPPEQWFSTFNVTFRHNRVEQTLPEMFGFSMSASTDLGITGLFALVTGTTADAVVVALGNEVIKLNFGSLDGDDMVLPGSWVVDDTHRERHQAVSASGSLYFTNLANGFFKFDGTTVSTVITSGLNYKGKYICNYTGHLMMANLIDIAGPTTYKLRVAWSDKEDYADWDPDVANESDFFDVDDDAGSASYGLGITGMAPLGDMVCVHTPGSIWNITYVGFEAGVMDIRKRIDGLGCWLPYGLASFDRYHIFPGEQDFWLYDGASIVAIGSDISRFFFSDLSPDPDERNRTWAWVDKANNEIRWYYVSRSSPDGFCDKCLVLYWPTKAWSIEAGFGRSAALAAGTQTRRSIDSLKYISATIDDLALVSASIDGLATNAVIPYPLFGKFTDLALWRNQTPDVEGTISDQTIPQIELITGDIVLGDGTDVSDILSFMLDASIAPGVVQEEGETFYSWKVYISARDYLHDEVDWQVFATFKGTETTKQLTEAQRCGRVFRFKFVSDNLIFTQFYGFRITFDARTTEK